MAPATAQNGPAEIERILEENARIRARLEKAEALLAIRGRIEGQAAVEGAEHSGAGTLEAVDASNGHAAENAALRESVRRLSGELNDVRQLQRITARLIQQDDVEALYGEIVDAAARLMQADFASLQMFYPDRGKAGELRLLAFRGFDPQAAQFWEWVRADSNCSCGVALGTRQRVVVPDIESCEFMVGTEDLVTYRQAGIQSVQSTPLLSRDGRLLGMLSTHWREAREPAERELNLLDLLARQIADLFERAQLDVVRARLAAIVESSDDAIISKNLDGVITSWNAGAERVFGYTADEAIGRSITMLIPPDRLDEEPAIIERIRRKERINHFETIRRRKDGELIDISLTISPVIDSHGRIAGVSKIARDITERKRTEQALRDSERRFREMIDALPAAIYTTDAVGRLTHFNPAAVEMSGRMPELGTDKWCVTWKLFNADGTPLPHDKCPMAVSLKEGRAVRGVEAIAERPDGTRVWFAPFPTPLFDSGGRLVGGINMLVDITERKRAEQAVRERQTWLDGQREALEAAVNGADLEDSLGVLVRTAIEGVGQDARAGFYLANDEGTALRHVVGMPPDYAEAVDGFKVGPDSVACGLATATGKPVLTSDVRNDPLWQPWLWMAEKFDYRACWSFPIHTAARRFVGTLAIYSRQPREATPRDQELGALLAHTASIIISRHKESEVRKQAEQALLSSERHLELVSNSVPALISYVGKDGRYRSCNNAYTTWFGLPREQIIGRPMREVLGEKAWEVIGPRIEAALRGETVEFEAEAHYDSGARWIHAVYTPHHAVDGTVEGIVVMVTDMTQRKRTDDRLRLLWEAAGILLSTDDPKAMLLELFRKISPHIGIDTYFNFMVEDNGDALRLASWVGVSEEMGRAIGRIQFGQAICGAVALQRKAIHATFIQQSDEPMVQLVKSLGIRAYACNPLLFEGRLLGTLSFASRSRDEFDSEELAFLETICQYVTVAYERLRLLDQLKEADRRKDEFLAALAHELRNPLNPIRNAVEALRIKGPPDAELQLERDVIGRQVEHLTRLIDDLLDINRIARDKLELRRQPVELSDIVQASIEMSRPLIDQSGHELSVTLPDEPVWLDGDPARLSQVMMNLLNNAAKYTEPGGQIWLNASRRTTEIEIAITDTGIGIAPEKLANLFDLFYQADRSLERAHGGLGIGLSLVRRFVEMHGGTVTAHSEGLGMGSQFVVRLPVLAEPPASASTPTKDLDQGRASSRRILVVDDNHDSAKMLATLLRLTGNEVETAFDGLEALQTGERFGPEVVLLDIGMPRLNGYETCRRIRQQPWGKEALLIAQTGWGQNEDKRRTAEAGFDAHFVKPVSLAALNRLLDKWQPSRV